MKIGILGSGRVAQILAAHWSKAGHTVTLGSREPAAATGIDAAVTSWAEAVSASEVVVNATPGSASLGVAEQIGADAFGDRVLIDVANATTQGFELLYPNSSLGERLQAALPAVKVVKTLNTAAMTVLVEPAMLAAGSVFLSGDDADAKDTVRSLLEDLGWAGADVIDLGGIESARGPEHYFLMFAALMRSFGTPQFNLHIVRE